MRLPSLQQFFRHQLQHSFRATGLEGEATVDYVSEVLAHFAYTHLFYALKDLDGRPLEYIVDMLATAERAQERRRTDSAVLKHIGDYTLFMSGLFRERVRARGELNYYMAHGRSAFGRSADYEANPARRHTFRSLCENFAPISDVLDHLRRVQLPLSDCARPDELLSAFWHA